MYTRISRSPRFRFLAVPILAVLGTMSCIGAQPGATGGPPASLFITGRTSNNPPLPVGFQDQLFGVYRDGGGAGQDIALEWMSETPALATIDERGVVQALAPGTARIRATAEDGTTATLAFPTRVAELSRSASYVGNTEFGIPTDADPGDDILVVRNSYTASWNPERGTPNWVSYNLEATHFGDEDRCDCFTFDPELPDSLPRYTTADYTGAGAFAGYGIDRGHLARSFDRTAGALDNAKSFYFTNIVPQTADLNQGPWAAMETYLGNLARAQGREVYIVTGVAGSLGTVKDEGRITIPAWTWKVAVVMERDLGLDDVQGPDDLEVIAVIMPNIPGIRDVDWESYRTSVDEVEAVSGYDLLAGLPEAIEVVVERGVGQVPGG